MAGTDRALIIFLALTVVFCNFCFRRIRSNSGTVGIVSSRVKCLKPTLGDAVSSSRVLFRFSVEEEINVELLPMLEMFPLIMLRTGIFLASVSGDENCSSVSSMRRAVWLIPEGSLVVDSLEGFTCTLVRLGAVIVYCEKCKNIAVV